MKNPLLTLTLILLTFFTANAQTPKAELAQLISQDWTFRMQEYPAWAASLGYESDRTKYAEVSVAAHERRAEFWRGILKKLNVINREALDAETQVNYDMFKFMLENDVAQVEYQSYLIPIDSDSGFHSSFAFSASDFSFDSVRSYEQYIVRLKGFKKYVDDHIALMRMGIKKGMTLPKIILTDYEKGMDAYISEKAKDSYFYEPFKTMNGIDKAQQIRLRK